MLFSIVIFGFLLPSAVPQSNTTSAPANEIESANSLPAEIVAINDYPITVTAGDVHAWSGGNRLVINATEHVQVLPGSYVPGSLMLKGPAGEKFESPRDYIVDDGWGAFAIKPDGQLRTGQKVLASYGYSLRRVDAVVVNEEGNVHLIRGQPSADSPLAPAVPSNAQHLANIYRPFNAKVVRAADVYRIRSQEINLSPLPPSPELEKVIQKLRNGGDVTVVCWGDSVTVGIDSGPPGTNYVSRFETKLKEKYPKAHIKVINAGINGSNIQSRFPAIQKEVLDFHPDLITLEFVNDMGLPPADLPNHYRQLLQKLRAVNAALIIMTPHFTSPQWMPEMANGHGPDRRPGVAFLRKFTKENGVPLADASRRWEQLEELGVPYEILLRNGINHPDERGHQIYVEELMRFFAP